LPLTAINAIAGPFMHDAMGRGGASPAPERFQEKWTPLFRFENAIRQRFRAPALIQSEREML
jgi:hypothetical protein